MKKILITGGAGFIGSSLSNLLYDRGHTIRVLDNLSQQIHGPIPEMSTLYKSLNPNIEFMLGSVTDKYCLEAALRDIDVVVHLAAETGTGQSMYSINRYVDTNINGTALILDLISNNSLPVEKVVVASSRAIYGEGKYACPHHGIVYPNPRLDVDMAMGDFSTHCPICGVELKVVATDETTPPNPSSIYGITKLAQEQLTLNVCKSLAISGIGLRYQNVYGPGQSLSNPYTGILSIFSKRMLMGKPVNIFEDGNESRDFVYIDDVVNITCKLIEDESTIIDSYNVGSGISTNVLTIAHTLRELLNSNSIIEVTGQFRIGDIRHNFADVTKLTSKLSLSKWTPLEFGLSNFTEWVKLQKITDDNYDNSLAELKDRGLFK